MNPTQILAACKALQVLATEAGFFRAEAYLQINWLYVKPFDLRFEMRSDPVDYKTRMEINFGADDEASLADLFTQAANWIVQQETPTQIRKQKFVTDLAHLVEEAEYLEMDPTPLREVFTAMTTNLLENHHATHPRRLTKQSGAAVSYHQ